MFFKEPRLLSKKPGRKRLTNGNENNKRNEKNLRPEPYLQEITSPRKTLLSNSNKISARSSVETALKKITILISVLTLQSQKINYSLSNLHIGNC